jgi:hypothetical protein
MATTGVPRAPAEPRAAPRPPRCRARARVQPTTAVASAAQVRRAAAPAISDPTPWAKDTSSDTRPKCAQSTQTSARLAVLRPVQDAPRSPLPGRTPHGASNGPPTTLFALTLKPEDTSRENK